MIADYFEALTAYRAFDVAGSGLLLGQAYSEAWPPYEPMVARCGAINSEGQAMAHLVGGRLRTSPVLHCTCGIHALKTLEAAASRVMGDDGIRWGWERLEGRAWGVIKLWGRIIEHDEGYRAEFAYPSELLCHDSGLAARIAALYGVPCQHTQPRIAERDVYHDGYIHGLSTLQGLGRMYRGGNFYFIPSRPLGVITGIIPGITDNIAQAPMVAQPKMVSTLGQIVGASRWQIRQYGRCGGKLNPSIVLPDWRTMLRKMVYKSG